MSFLLVGIGGFFGSISRYCFYLIERNLGLTTFPIATLVINTLGCLLAGIVITYGSQRFHVAHPYTLVLTVGFLGSFTTFSTFALETSSLARNGLTWQAFLNIALNVCLGIVAAYLGRVMIETSEG